MIRAITAAVMIFASVSAFSTIKVSTPEKFIEVQQTINLSNILQVVGPQRDWYWPAAKLYQLDDKDIGLLKERVLTISQQNGFESLTREIAAWQVAGRVLREIDYDLARLSPKNDLTFYQDQNYHLILTSRPTSIEVFGAVTKSITLNYVDGHTINDYVEQVSREAQANFGVVWVIQSDGRVFQTGVDVFNDEKRTIMPGSKIYVPFKENLLNVRNKSFNADVVELTKHKLPDWAVQ